MAKVSCQNCGAKVEIPAGFAKARIRCPGCGYYADVPAEADRGSTSVVACMGITIQNSLVTNKRM